MTQFTFFLAHYFAIAFLALLGYLLGRRLTLLVHYHSVLEQVSLSMALGLGVIAYLVLLLGLLGLLYPLLLLITLLVAGLFCYQVWIGWPRGLLSILKRVKAFRKLDPALTLAVIIVLIVLSLPLWLLPLYPPTGFDETLYHLASAKLYAQNHQVIFTPYLRFPVFPQTNQMLFTLALLFFDDILARLIQLLLMIILTLGVIAFGQRYFSRRAGWWSAAILLANPLVLWSGSTAYIDMGLMLYVMVAVYALWNWSQWRERHWLVLAGIFCGLAVGVKYPALFFVGVLQIVALHVSFRERKYLRPFLFGLIAFLTSAPWLARNIYYTGNPVFPFFHETFTSVFGHGLWKPEYYTGMLTDIPNYGIGKSLKALIMLPWHLSFNQQSFPTEAPLSPLYFYLLPLLALAGVMISRIRPLLTIVVAFTLFWFFSIQVMRYLLPALPLLSLAAGASLDSILRWGSAVRKLTDYKLIIALGFGVLIYPGWNYARLSVAGRGPLPVTQQQRDRYLTSRLPSYPLYKLLNNMGRQNYKVYALFDENMAYFVDGVYMGDWFGPASYARIVEQFSDGRALYDELKSLGADYLLINNLRFREVLPRDSFFRENFTLIDAQGNALLFDLNGTSVRHPTGRQLLLNPGFEDLKEGWPSGWEHVGAPIIDTSGQYSHTGSSAVRSIGATNVFYQSVAVQPGKNYLLNFEVRTMTEGQTARMQVNWSDAHGKFLSTDILVVEVGTVWKPCVTTVIAPEQAAYAVVYASGHENSSVWFDDFSFVETQSSSQP
jgi:4-amino-4-deoxy-L-arabinose transferase-like glycosyltransferase